MADFKRHRIGQPVDLSTGTVSATNFTLNQTTDKAEFIFKSSTNEPITRVGFRNGTINGTATTWKASLQGVDATNGNPDGTIKGGGSPASVTFTNAALTANTWIWFNLANPYTPTRGDDLALAIAYDSGTTPSAGVNDLAITVTANLSSQTANPYAIQNDNGTRTKLSASLPSFGYGTATRAFGFPLKASYAPAVNSGTNPNEVALRFLLPAGAGTTLTVVGARFLATVPAAATNSLAVRLYSGTTVLQEVTVDAEIVSASGSRWFEVYFDEAILATLSLGNEYRLALAPQTATSWNAQGLTVGAAADMAAYIGGEDFYLSTRNGGAWTDDATTRPYIEAIIESWSVRKPPRGRLGS